MSARSAAVTMPRVAGTSRMCSEITSHSAKNAALLGAVSKPSARASARVASRAHTTTRMPNARAYSATARLMRPKPYSPSVLPRRVVPTPICQRPAWSDAAWRGKSRTAARTSAHVSSAAA